MKNGLLENKIAMYNSLHLVIFINLVKEKLFLFPSHVHHVTKCFDVIRSMSLVLSHAKYEYFLTFINDYSRLTWLDFPHSKVEVFTMLKIFMAYLKSQF